MNPLTPPPLITNTAAKKLASIGGSFLALSASEAFQFVQHLRDRRIKPLTEDQLATKIIKKESSNNGIEEKSEEIAEA